MTFEDFIVEGSVYADYGYFENGYFGYNGYYYNFDVFDREISIECDDNDSILAFYDGYYIPSFSGSDELVVIFYNGVYYKITLDNGIFTIVDFSNSGSGTVSNLLNDKIDSLISAFAIDGEGFSSLLSNLSGNQNDILSKLNSLSSPDLAPVLNAVNVNKSKLITLSADLLSYKNSIESKVEIKINNIDVDFDLNPVLQKIDNFTFKYFDFNETSYYLNPSLEFKDLTLSTESLFNLSMLSFPTLNFTFTEFEFYRNDEFYLELLFTGSETVAYRCRYVASDSVVFHNYFYYSSENKLMYLRLYNRVFYLDFLTHKITLIDENYTLNILATLHKSLFNQNNNLNVILNNQNSKFLDLATDLSNKYQLTQNKLVEIEVKVENIDFTPIQTMLTTLSYALDDYANSIQIKISELNYCDGFGIRIKSLNGNFGTIQDGTLVKITNLKHNNIDWVVNGSFMSDFNNQSMPIYKLSKDGVTRFTPSYFLEL